MVDVQLDLLPVRDQLQAISQTDILIGMHGAAFAFGLFLPSGAGEIEMYPMVGIKHIYHI